MNYRHFALAVAALVAMAFGTVTAEAGHGSWGSHGSFGGVFSRGSHGSHGSFGGLFSHGSNGSHGGCYSCEKDCGCDDCGEAKSDCGCGGGESHGDMKEEAKAPEAAAPEAAAPAAPEAPAEAPKQ